MASLTLCLLPSWAGRCWGLRPSNLTTSPHTLQPLHGPPSSITTAFQYSLTQKLNVVISKGCCNKLPLTWWLKTAEMSSLIVLEARSPKSRCWQGQLLEESLREVPCMPLSWLLVAPEILGVPWRVDSSLEKFSHLFSLRVYMP